jgi:hypothetical protein
MGSLSAVQHCKQLFKRSTLCISVKTVVQTAKPVCVEDAYAMGRRVGMGAGG